MNERTYQIRTKVDGTWRDLGNVTACDAMAALITAESLFPEYVRETARWMATETPPCSGETPPYGGETESQS